MLIVNETRVDPDPTDPTHAYAEASDLGLAPGEWPDWISVVDDAGDGDLYGFPIPLPGAEDLAAMDYRSLVSDHTLTVWND